MRQRCRAVIVPAAPPSARGRSEVWGTNPPCLLLCRGHLCQRQPSLAPTATARLHAERCGLRTHDEKRDVTLPLASRAQITTVTVVSVIPGSSNPKQQRQRLYRLEQSQQQLERRELSCLPPTVPFFLSIASFG